MNLSNLTERVGGHKIYSGIMVEHRSGRVSMKDNERKRKRRREKKG